MSLRAIPKTIFTALCALVKALPQQGYGAPPPPSPGLSYGAPDLRAEASNINQLGTDPIAALGASIPGGGIPGQDYPILASVPDTGFTCEAQEFPGYYADTADEAGCQVFHICQFDNRQDSFLCPNGTIFNQQYFVCDWWYNVDCAATAQFIGLNAEIGRIPEDNVAAASNSASSLSNSYGAPPTQAQAPSQLYNSPSSSLPSITTPLPDQASQISPPMLNMLSRMKAFHESKVSRLDSHNQLMQIPSKGLGYYHSYPRPSANHEYPSTSNEPLRGGPNAGSLHSTLIESNIHNDFLGAFRSTQENQTETRFIESENSNVKVQIPFQHNYRKKLMKSLSNMTNPFANHFHTPQKIHPSSSSAPFFNMKPHLMTYPSLPQKIASLSAKNYSKLHNISEFISQDHEPLTLPSTDFASVLSPFSLVSVNSTEHHSMSRFSSSPDRSSDLSVFPPEIPVSRVHSQTLPLLAHITPSTPTEFALIENIPSHLPDSIKNTMLVDLLLHMRLFIAVNHEPPEFLIS
ncbi:hypothetical protein SK128_009635 [Halocaridina rubra]|uniref:Chitin-binding type-2 domain-containing protein n=1 Tax=Halocaridina rubra TaxID=373956 RepID=A0AAN8X719_HALRR